MLTVLAEGEVVRNDFNRAHVGEAHAEYEGELHVKHTIVLLTLQYEIHIGEDWYVSVRHLAAVFCGQTWQAAVRGLRVADVGMTEAYLTNLYERANRIIGATHVADIDDRSR